MSTELPEPRVVQSVPGSTKASVRFSTLGAHALSFLVGAAIVLIFQNIAGRESLRFTTTEVISFLFGVALSGASIVLAIAAISLGKASEQAMIERSDASIRLQNEVFVKTTEALGRIESSTGVTEKRIEDIISGRAGELSHAIAENISSGVSSKHRTKEELEKEIRESIVQEFSASRTLESRESRRERMLKAEQSESRYRTFQNLVLTSIVNAGGIQCERIGDGTFGANGHALFDGVFKATGGLVGVSSLATLQPTAAAHVASFREFIISAARQLNEGAVVRVIGAFDGPIAADGQYRKQLADLSGVVKPEILERIHLVDGEQSETIAKVIQLLRGEQASQSVVLHAS